MLRSPLALALPLLWLCACGVKPEAQLEKARADLAKGDYATAAATAAQGLAGGAEGATAWRLENVALEAEARSARYTSAKGHVSRVKMTSSSVVSSTRVAPTTAKPAPGPM